MRMSSQGRPAILNNGDVGADILRSLQDYSDIASWINDALDVEGDEAEGERDLTELERHVSHLSAILEVACEDTSSQLERTIEDVSRTVPRLTYDLQLMQESAFSLQIALQAVERHSESFLNTSEIGNVLDKLHYLDMIKRNMEASLAVLREAEAWSSLESEVVSYLAEQAYSKAAARLSEASKSLSVFQNTPEYETRRTLMINLQNQLEAALSSALVAGINNNDVDACKRYFDIFCHIEREAEFRSYWNGSKRKRIVALWHDAKLRDSDDSTANPDGKNFSSFLPEFYHELLSVLQVERLSATLIFPDPQPSLSTFITSTLSSLHPSASQVLNALVNFYGDLVLPELISSFKATEEFAVATDKIMEKVGYSAMSPAVIPAALDDRETPSSTSRVQRRRSARQSFSRRLHRSSISGLPPANLGASSAPLDHSWEEALFEPFLDYQCDYGTLEKRLLRAQLKNLLSTTSSASVGARLLRERAIDVLGFADEALARCLAFTHGYGVAELIQALDDLLGTFLQSARRDILDASNAHSADVGAFDPGEEFAELDYSPSDLASFQLALHLLEATRGILERLIAFEAKLRTNTLQISSAIRMARNDPFGLYVSGTTRTALNLLQSSALNSLELRSLLDAVDPEQPPPPTQVPHSVFTPMSATFVAQKTPALAAAQTQSRTALLLGARSAVSEFAKACQMRLQETLLTPLFKHLSTYASSPAWISVDPKDRRAGTSSLGVGGTTAGAVNEVVMPSFSLSASNAIQRVAEGLLSLPRLFEVYADDDALAFSIETLPYVDSERLLAMSAEAVSVAATTTTSAPTGNEAESNELATGTRPKARHFSSSSSSLSISVPSNFDSHSSQQSTLLLTPETLSSAWLTSLTLTLLSHLTFSVLPSIARLSTRGAAQLAEDLSYLSQIAKALAVEWGPLEVWRDAVSVPTPVASSIAGADVHPGDDADGEIRRRIADLSVDANGEEGDGEGVGNISREESLEIWRTVAKLRGILL